MDASGPFAGLRVLDLCDEKGALAGKLLAGSGRRRRPRRAAGGERDAVDPALLERRAAHRAQRLLLVLCRGEAEHHARPEAARRVPRASAGSRPDADVVVTTDAATAGALRAGNPRLVVASITPFGRSGPYRDWKASDTVAQAMGGMLYVNGHPDGPPLRSLGLQAYHQAGILAAVGIVSALIARDVTGRGQDVDVSLQAAVAGALEHVPGFWHQARLVHRRQGTLHWTRYFRVGRCRDGWVMHCTLGDWTSLIEWMKADGMGADLDDPGARGHQDAAGGGGAHLRRARRVGRALHGRRADRRAPNSAASRTPAVRPPEALPPRPAPVGARLLRADRAPRPRAYRARTPARRSV
jgi:hypothetical protein